MINLKNLDTLPRAIAVDLDGTLLDSQTRLSKRNQRALEKCIALGVPVIIATSRAARIFDRIFTKEFTSQCSLAFMNGAVAKGNPPLSGYFKETLDENIMRSIINFALKFNINIRITLELDGYKFGTNWTTDPATLWERNAATPDMLLTLEKAITMQPCKIALGGLGRDILKLGETITDNFSDTISVVSSLLDNPLLNITSSQASKPSALQKLLTPVGISLDGVIAFGDDLPDVEMLKKCGISVAVANAFPEVKAICKYETLSNDRDGVAVVLEQVFGF